MSLKIINVEGELLSLKDVILEIIAIIALIISAILWLFDCFRTTDEIICAISVIYLSYDHYIIEKEFDVIDEIKVVIVIFLVSTLLLFRNNTINLQLMIVLTVMFGSVWFVIKCLEWEKSYLNTYDNDQDVITDWFQIPSESHFGSWWREFKSLTLATILIFLIYVLTVIPVFFQFFKRKSKLKKDR